MPTQTTFPLRVYMKSQQEIEATRIRAAMLGKSSISSYVRDLIIFDLMQSNRNNQIQPPPELSPEQIKQIEQAAEPSPEKPTPTIEDFKKLLGDI
jgi:hypothetical protein